MGPRDGTQGSRRGNAATPIRPRRVRFLLAPVLAGFAIAACGPSRPLQQIPLLEAPLPEEASAPPNEAPDYEELYGRIDGILRDYEEGVELIVAGEEVLGEAKLAAASNRLDIRAAECAESEGCDVGRFIDAFTRLLSRQAIALKTQAYRIDTLETSAAQDVEREPGTTQFVKVMPEIGKTVSLLRGTDLRDIITLNGPVSAALDDWLTWMRPLLMESYENYRFLRAKIAPIYEEAGLPEALLFALIATETGGKVHSYSRAGAAGPFQFMRHTGRRYGLGVVDGFDMRLDPVAATRASVSYLNDQFEKFNNSLEKVLAAYNGGESRLTGLDRRLRGISLWDNRMYYSLPRETREYVPRVLAAAWLFLHPDDYNLEFPHPETETTRLVLRHEIALGELTICLGQEQNPGGWFRTLRNLNPRFGPGDRIPAGEEIEIPSILVPVYEENCLRGEHLERARILHDANYPDEPEMIPYYVRRGDTLSRIAAQHRCVSLHELAEINRIRPPRYLIRVGQMLKIPNCDF